MQKSNLVTAAAIGIIAYAAADVVHEAAHALVANLLGIRVQSISTFATQTIERSRAVAAAGTIANVVFGLIACTLVERRRTFGAGVYCLWLFGVVCLMNSGYLVYSGVANAGDWTSVIVGLQPALPWRLATGAVGVIFYTTAIRIAVHSAAPWIANGDASIADLRRVIGVSYVTGGVLLVLGSAFNPVGREPIVLSGIGASFGLTLGLLLVPGILASQVKEPGWISGALELQPAWIAVALVVGIVFVGFLGPGVRLAQ